MDNVLEKIGLYELFGGFVPGMIIIVAWICLDMPNIFLGRVNDNLQLTFFFVESYFLGIIFQELGSMVDKQTLNLRERWKKVFLSERNDVVKNKIELGMYRKIANQILEKNENNIDFTAEEQQAVFNYCKNYLEANGKNRKEYSLDSSYSLNRSLVIAFIFLLIVYLFICLNNQVFQSSEFIRILILCDLIIILYKRAEKYSRLRTHAVMQHYEALKRKNSNNEISGQV